MRCATLIQLTPLLATLASACATTQAAQGDAAKPKAEANVFEGCTGQAVAAGAVQLTCGKQVVSQSEAGNDATPEALRDAFLAGLRGSVEGKGSTLETEDQELQLQGKSYPAVSFAVRHPQQGPEPFFGGHLVSLRAANGNARAVSCSGPLKEPATPTRCRALLAAVVSGGIPDELLQPAVATGPVRLAGRNLTIPEGCKLVANDEDHGTIGCGDNNTEANFSWFNLDKGDGPAMLTMLFEQIQKQLPENVSESLVPCRLEGVATSCRMLEGADETTRFQVMGGFAEVRGATLLVVCANQGGAVHPACNGALTRD